jgi:hypothetical protein
VDYLLHEQYTVCKKVSRLRDVFVYWYWRHPLQLVQEQENTGNHRIRKIYIFTHLITESKFICSNVYFLSLLPQIWMIQNNT